MRWKGDDFFHGLTLPRKAARISLRRGLGLLPRHEKSRGDLRAQRKQKTNSLPC